MIGSFKQLGVYDRTIFILVSQQGAIKIRKHIDDYLLNRILHPAFKLPDETTVNRLAQAFPVSRPAISKHLRCLREAGLVTEERQGRRRIYRLQAQALGEVGGWVDSFGVTPEPARARAALGRAARRRTSTGRADEPGGWRVW